MASSMSLPFHNIIDTSMVFVELGWQILLQNDKLQTALAYRYSYTMANFQFNDCSCIFLHNG